MRGDLGQIDTFEAYKIGELAGPFNDERPPLLKFRSYCDAVRAFSSPLGTCAAFPAGIEDVVRRIESWNRTGQQALCRLQSPPIYRQVFGFSSVVFDTHPLLRAVHTRRIDDWLGSPSTTGETKAAFENYRFAFIERYEAVRALTADILLSSNLDMFDENPLLLSAIFENSSSD